MKKWTACIMIALFFVITLFPLWGHLLPGSDDAVEGENRAMAQWPEAGTPAAQLPQALEDYLGDHLAFRKLFVDIANRAQGASNESRIVNNVATGSAGYLFYMANGSQEDILRQITLTEEELADIAAAQSENVRLVEAAGAQYVLMVCPDKHTIYPEYLPAFLRGGRGESRLDQALTVLNRIDGLHFADARETVLAAKGDMPLFLKTDTHWNALGAYQGYTALAQTLSQLLPSFRAVTEADVAVGEVTEWSGGDMAGMLGQELTDVAVACNVISPSAQRVAAPYEDTNSDPARQMALFENPNHPELPTAVVFQDSFCEAMKPYLAEGFSRILFVWSANLCMDYVLAEQPDVVIMEYVERLSPAMCQDPVPASGESILKKETEGLPLSSGRMQMCVDDYRETDESASITGWAFLPGRDAKAGELTIVLRKEDEICEIKADAVSRPDVTEYFSSQYGNDLNGSGFTAQIPLVELEEGRWEIYVALFGKDGTQDSVNTGKTLTVRRSTLE